MELLTGVKDAAESLPEDHVQMQGCSSARWNAQHLADLQASNVLHAIQPLENGHLCAVTAGNAAQCLAWADPVFDIPCFGLIGCTGRDPQFFPDRYQRGVFDAVEPLQGRHARSITLGDLAERFARTHDMGPVP